MSNYCKEEIHLMLKKYLKFEGLKIVVFPVHVAALLFTKSVFTVSKRRFFVSVKFL